MVFWDVGPRPPIPHTATVSPLSVLSCPRLPREPVTAVRTSRLTVLSAMPLPAPIPGSWVDMGNTCSTLGVGVQGRQRFGPQSLVLRSTNPTSVPPTRNLVWFTPLLPILDGNWCVPAWGWMTLGLCFFFYLSGCLLGLTPCVELEAAKSGANVLASVRTVKSPRAGPHFSHLSLPPQLVIASLPELSRH